MWKEQPDHPGVWIKVHVCRDNDCGGPHAWAEPVEMDEEDIVYYDSSEWSKGALWTEFPLIVK